jgi:hypothetical protein
VRSVLGSKRKVKPKIYNQQLAFWIYMHFRRSITRGITMALSSLNWHRLSVLSAELQILNTKKILTNEETVVRDWIKLIVDDLDSMRP